jgi:pilus assembly protein CpaE
MPEEIISVALRIKDPETAGEFEDIVGALDFARLKKAEEAGFPDVLIMEITEDRKKEFEFIESILSSGETRIFLTSSESRPEILLQTMRMGVSDFFPQPLKKEEIERAFKKVKEQILKKAKKTKQGVIISVLAAKGGCGTTTVATNLATSLAHLSEMHGVAIVDLNLLIGDVPTFLDISPRYTLAEISKNIDRLDSAFLMGLLTRHLSGVYVLSSPDNMDEINQLKPDDIGKTLTIMRTVFDFTIVDAYRSFDPLAIKVFDLSDIIFLVATLDIPSLRNAKRLMDTFHALGYSEDKIKLVVNRYTKGSEIPLKEAEKALKCEAFWLIPNDYLAVIASIDQGKSLTQIAPNAEIAKSFRKFAMMLTQARGVKKEVKTKEAGFLVRLLGKQKD